MVQPPSEPDLSTERDLVPVLQELLAREPLFHHRELVSTRSEFERETDPGFWEVGASGRRYSREHVWSVLRGRFLDEADEAVSRGWQLADAQLRRLGPDTYLLTYTLFAVEPAVTRRLTIWQGSGERGWKALFHQGTVVAGA